MRRVWKKRRRRLSRRGSETHPRLSALAAGLGLLPPIVGGGRTTAANSTLHEGGSWNSSADDARQRGGVGVGGAWHRRRWWSVSGWTEAGRRDGKRAGWRLVAGGGGSGGRGEEEEEEEEEEDTVDLQLGKASFTKIHLLVDPAVAARVRSVT